MLIANRESSNIEFRKVKSLQFLYEVSSDGRVIRNVKSKKHLRQYRDSQGFWLVSGKIKGNLFYRTVCSIVSECWLGDMPNGYRIEYIDGNKNNNHYKNFRYVKIDTTVCKNQPVRIVKENESNTFNTLQDCAKYLSNITGSTYNSIKSRLCKRRRFILGYTIEYIR